MPDLTAEQEEIAWSIKVEIGVNIGGSSADGYEIRLNPDEWPGWVDLEGVQIWGWPVRFDLPSERYVIATHSQQVPIDTRARPPETARPDPQEIP